MTASKILRIAGLLMLASLAISGVEPSSATVLRNYEFINGSWFDGERFIVKKFYSVNGHLTSRRPDRVERIFDLSGKYVVPPFGEAHNHNVEEASLLRYLQAGIFYVKSPNNLPDDKPKLRGKINLPATVDMIFAPGGLTASSGHPIGVVRRNIERGFWTKAQGEGAFYFTLDNLADLDSKWEKIKALRPDFIKTYLLYSEEYANRRDDEYYFAWKGLNPALLPEIVRRAHGVGLRVTTHVETATDFHNAVVAGVDEINHLPGFRPDQGNPKNYEPFTCFEIAEADARLASRKGIVVVTTLGSAIEKITFPPSGASRTLIEGLRKLLIRNLELLRKHGVAIAIGSDQYRRTAVYEAMHLDSLKVFDNLTLLRMWCETTAKTIFPKRKIGRLAEGYEASFLVLSRDPLDDFANTQKIEMRIKQGEILNL